MATKEPEITDGELNSLRDNPDALRLIADWHDNQAAMGEAMGDCGHCVEHHELRAKALRDAAAEIESRF